MHFMIQRKILNKNSDDVVQERSFFKKDLFSWKVFFQERVKKWLKSNCIVQSNVTSILPGV